MEFYDFPLLVQVIGFCLFYIFGMFWLSGKIISIELFPSAGKISLLGIVIYLIGLTL